MRGGPSELSRRERRAFVARRAAAWTLGPVALLVAMGGGCQGSGSGADLPPVPTLPPPEIPPPPGVEEKTVIVGFDRERIELEEGERAAVRIAFDPRYPRGSPGGLEDALTFDLLVEVEPGSGGAEDLLVSGGVRVGDYHYVLEAGTTWLALRAAVDGVAEAPETLRLRLLPALPGVGIWHPGVLVEGQYPAVFEFRNGVLEVSIRDGGAADRCRDVQLTASPPREAFRRRYDDGCFEGEVYETAVTVEADRSAPMELDRVTSHGRIADWRVEVHGERVRHHFAVQWSPEEERHWDLRLQPCASEGGGPTLLCTVDSCRIYPEGSELPRPRKPRCTAGRR